MEESTSRPPLLTAAYRYDPRAILEQDEGTERGTMYSEKHMTDALLRYCIAECAQFSAALLLICEQHQAPRRVLRAGWSHCTFLDGDGSVRHPSQLTTYPHSAHVELIVH